MKCFGKKVKFAGAMLLILGAMGLHVQADSSGPFSGEFDDFSAQDDSVEQMGHEKPATSSEPKEVAATSTAASQPRPRPSRHGGALHYKIGVGDNVKVHVWRNADLSTTVPVRPDGFISMPLLGDIKASGLKPTELAEVIRLKLSSYLRDPRVSVIMLGLSSNEYINRVRVTGAVNRPTSVPFREGMTVLDLILDTGGVSQFASPNKTKIFRKSGGKSEVLKVRLSDILEKADLKTNYAILPGDVITVPERLF